MNKMMSNKKALALFILPTFFIFFMVIVVTVVSSGVISTLEWDGMGKAEFVGLRNYIEIFQNDVFIKALKNSVILLVCTVAIQLPTAIILALMITSDVKHEKLFRTIYFIPVIIMTAVTGQLWIKLYDPTNGLINQILEAIGLEQFQHNWLVEKSVVMFSAAIPSIWQWMGYHMLIIYSAIKTLPKEIYESAQIDGANRIKIAWYITLPNIMPMIKVSLTFMVVGSMKAFDLIYILTDGGPVHASEVPTITMYKTIFSKYHYGPGSAMALVIVAICLIYAMTVTKVFKKAEERLD